MEPRDTFNFGSSREEDCPSESDLLRATSPTMAQSSQVVNFISFADSKNDQFCEDSECNNFDPNKKEEEEMGCSSRHDIYNENRKCSADHEGHS